MERDYILENYLAQEDGTIIYKKTNKPVVFALTKLGYYKARLYTKLSNHKDHRKPYFLHRVMALIFLDNYSSDLQVNHKNGIRTDNRIENLEMVSHKENQRHSWDVLNRESKIKRDSKGKFTKIIKII